MLDGRGLALRLSGLGLGGRSTRIRLRRHGGLAERGQHDDPEYEKDTQQGNPLPYHEKHYTKFAYNATAFKGEHDRQIAGAALRCR